MIDDNVKRYLLPQAFNAALRAGAEIMNVYSNQDDYDTDPRGEHGSITVANRLAHQTIRDFLGTTRIPILSEDGREMQFEERCNWEIFWLVDPLDGTFEFINNTDEFTVNIALMESNVCKVAVIYLPSLERIYVAGREWGSFRKDGVKADLGASYTYESVVEGWVTMPLEREQGRPPRVAVSRAYQTPETHIHIEELRKQRGDLEVLEQGSSYKFCLLAEGVVDHYVRTSDTYEWDTAAGELILAEAGGRVRALLQGGELVYNKEDLRNPWFVCRSKYSEI